MTIMRIISQLIRQNSTAASQRWLCTAVAEEATAAVSQRKKKSILLYQVAKAKDSESSVADVLNKWVNEGNEIRKSDFVSLSNYFRSRKNFTTALQVLWFFISPFFFFPWVIYPYQLHDWMESSKLEITNADEAIRIDLLSKTEGIASAENYFNSLQVSEKTSKTYGSLLSCYYKEKHFDKAVEIFEEMKVLNCTSTLNYNGMLSLHHSMEQHEKVISLVQEMEEKNIALDLYSYNTLINSCAALMNFDAIEGILEIMISNNVECNLFTYGNLATIYFNSGLHEKANDFLVMMEKMKNQPKKEVVDASHTLITLYSEMNNLSGVNRAWESLKSSMPTPSNTSYHFMLLALSKLGDQESLEKLFKEWEEGCSVYNCRLPNVLLEYYLSRDMIEEASLLYEKLENNGTEPNLKMLEFFATLCVKKGEIDLGLKYLEMGLDKAEKMGQGYGKSFPTDETIKLFVNYFEQKNDVEREEKFIQSMKKVNRLDPESLLMNSKASNAGS
ncbi:hypothetical protein BUALT_Bualt19G0071200 [Buddleja alternifolia]|uniref:Pentatricopeptide repeat-containing protein n=1 Tax=Buddleja alternifolia TaxID=168488 RepID=A0AAV6W215_9LAMI|nr:hypothetical protein BUALT_Bualt19G0071200 [Buddleja alternifolia]